MYDPFATPPPPGTMQATGVPQQNQVLPNPAPVAPNNALAALYNKHMRNFGNMQFPFDPGAGWPNRDHGRGAGWRQDYQQATADWRGDKPQMPSFDGVEDKQAQMTAYQDQRSDWRDLRPRARDYRMGTVPASGV